MRIEQETHEISYVRIAMWGNGILRCDLNMIYVYIYIYIHVHQVMEGLGLH